MPSDMRLQCPSEDTPPSTRPPSVASSAASASGTPHRSTSMDSLNTNSSISDKPTGEEYIPTRLIRPAPKVNTNALQFIKTGPAMLHKSAKEQMKKADVVKTLRKTSLQEEEEEWQSSSSSKVIDEGSDWLSNLDKWKSSRRKRNEDVLERVIEVKKNEQDDEYSRMRRKSKTFSEMREEKSKRGRRYNLVVHDDDNNDLSDLGLNAAKNGQSMSDPPEEGEAKSDAGFCTGSDTGSDGVFAEDNISDTSSALGDKREIHDSLLDSGSPTVQKDSDAMLNGHDSILLNSSSSTKSTSTSIISSEYTYDKAIEEYKQFAENSAKKRTSSVTSLSSNASGSKEEHEKVSSIKKLDEKSTYFESISREPKILRRERTGNKVDIDKRRSMFELREIDHQDSRAKIDRRSFDISSSLRNKVASFENINDVDNKMKAARPLRDTKFKEKLASFSQKDRMESNLYTQRKTPERDQNFYQKLHCFAQLETKTDIPRGGSLPRKASPERKPCRSSEKNISLIESSERIYDRRTSPAPTPLKDRIASFENLAPASATNGKRELSVSMENLNKYPLTDGSRVLQSSQSVTNLFRRTPSTPFMVVEVDEELEEKTCVKKNILRDYEIKSLKLDKRNMDESKQHSSVNPPQTDGNSSVPPPLPEKTRPRTLPSVPPTRIPSRISTDKHLSRNSSETLTPDLHPARVFEESRAPRIHPPSRVLEEMRAPRVLPDVPKRQLIDESKYTSRPDVLPDKPELNLNGLPDSFFKTSHEPPSKVPEEAPPPVPPPRVPTIEDPYPVTSTPYSALEDDLKENGYGDQDIDEVIDNYESLSETLSSCDDRTLHEISHTSDQTENSFEKISEEPVYGNIFEKITENLESSPDTVEELSNTHPLESEDSNTERKSLSPSPPLPPKNKNLSVFEVLDVTWTENNYSSPAAPPSVPPPPPPPEEEEEEEELDASTEVGEIPPSTITPSSTTPLENEGRSLTKVPESSPQSTKQELRRMMSDFLGSKPHVEEEITLQPPPDVSEILRQEREAERLIVQRQGNLARESPILDSDYSSGGHAFGRQKYTWEDRMKADGPRTETDLLDESADPLEFHIKLAELEQEMEKHDRDMLQRVKGPQDQDRDMLQRVKGPQDQEQRIYNDDGATDIPPPVQYSEIQNPPIEATHFESNINHSSNTVKSNQAVQNVSNTPEDAAPLPIQEFYSAPTFFTENKSMEAAYNFRNKVAQETLFNESTSIARDVKRVDREEPPQSRTLPQVPPPVPRKQSILALSAIPKPKLTDNDSWIMKRKAEANKKDYSKHWLIQEAEQRRLEQQDRIARPMQLPICKPINTIQSTPGYQDHFQNMKSSFHPPSNTYNSPATGANGSHIPTTNIPIKKPNTFYNGSSSAIHPSNDNSKPLYKQTTTSSTPPNSAQTNWMKQTKTYQPPQPVSPSSSGNKPLPDAIITSITQRVNNKINGSSNSRTAVYNSANNNIRSDDNYHDYMNTGAFNPAHPPNNSNPSPVSISPSTQGLPASSHLPSGSQQGQISEDQRLLSVSGKKKCSHCGEELGRGAAMIIESLRLFYHIPCFKCCVCGIQLGNGTSGADVRVRNHKLHCHNCYSNDEGMKFSKV